MDSAVSELLGGEEVLGPSINSNLDLARATREGLPTRAAAELAAQIAAAFASDPASWLLVESASIEPRGDATHSTGSPPAWVAQAQPHVDAMGPLGRVMTALIAETHRRRLDARLTTAESDVVVRTATAFAHATEVLGDKRKAIHWLNRPNQALGGEVPMSLMDTSAGEHEVQSLLDRIEFGVYS